LNKIKDLYEKYLKETHKTQALKQQKKSLDMNKVRLVNMSLKRNIDINAKLKTLSEISSKK